VSPKGQYDDFDQPASLLCLTFTGGLFAPVALIGLIHIIGGIAVLEVPQAAYVSQLSGLMMLLPHPTSIAIGLILVGVMAVTARLLRMSERTRAALIAPRKSCS
jgi:hypothetical protein